MTLPQKFYLTHMYDRTKYRANWLPDKALRIGDIGKLEDGIFTLYTTLEQQGISFQTRTDRSNMETDYSAKDSFSIESNVDSGTKEVKATIKIGFSKDNGLVYQMNGVSNVQISNLADVENAILAKYANKTWPTTWFVITELVKAENLTVIISTSSNSSLELECDGEIKFAQQSLANPNISLTLKRETGSTTKIIGSKNLTPLFRVRGVQKPLLGKAGLKTRGETDFTVKEELKFSNQDFDLKELA